VDSFGVTIRCASEQQVAGRMDERQERRILRWEVCQLAIEAAISTSQENGLTAFSEDVHSGQTFEVRDTVVGRETQITKVGKTAVHSISLVRLMEAPSCGGDCRPPQRLSAQG
jgi:hypothetical protein